MSDYIKRSDAIKAVWGDDINPSEDGMVYEAQSHIDRDIRLIPSADRPSGEWIIGENENDGWCKCSACGYANITCEVYPVGLGAYNFCPNCGARMKGADDEHDKRTCG